MLLSPRVGRKSPGPSRPRLRVEALEDRTVPASISFSVTALDGRFVTVSGQVTGAGVERVPVTFSGVLQGSAWTDTNGTFTRTIEASALGTIYAVAVTSEGSTDQASTQLTSPPPTFSYATACMTEGNHWRFFGDVDDDAPSDLAVAFTGLNLEGQNTQTWAEGDYEHILDLTEYGTVTATVTDVWGQTATATFQVINPGF